MRIVKYILVLVVLLSPSLAQADFRKALDALQRAQGAEMLVELEDAVNQNNNDGLSIFLGTLSERYRDGEFYIKNRTGDNSYSNSSNIKYHLLLGENSIPELMALLERAVSTSEINTQFDFAVLKSKLETKLNRFNLSDDQLAYFANNGSKRAQAILVNKRLYADDKLDEKALAEAPDGFKFIQQSASEGNLDAALMLAMIYLQWSPSEKHPIKRFFKVVQPDGEKGVVWLKRYAVQAHVGEPAVACKLASAYYSGNKIKQDKKQAYLWYLESAFNTYSDADECTLDGLRVMAYVGDLGSYNSKLVEVIKSEVGESNQKTKAYLSSLRGKVNRPHDITVALKSEVDEQLAYSVKENRYSLEVYKNGLVNFEGFSGADDRVASYIVGRDSWRIPKEKVKELLAELTKGNVLEASNYAFEGALCDSGEIFRNGIVKINANNQYKEIQYSTIGHSFSTPFMAEIFKVQESIAPTQHLRCGAAKADYDYKNCVAEDNLNIKRADKR